MFDTATNADFLKPIWSPDGSHIFFAGKREHYSIYVVDPRGAEPEQLVLDTGTDAWPLDVSADGRFLAYGEGVNIGRTRSKIWVYPLSSKRQPFRLQQGEAVEADARFSPDEHWVTYASNESGRDEVYVVPFAAPRSSDQTKTIHSSGKWQISNSGGHAPKWNQNEKELFYLGQDNKLMAVTLSIRDSTFAFDTARALFQANPSFYSLAYDVMPDGRRFITNTAPQEKTAPITVVENWLSDFSR